MSHGILGGKRTGVRCTTWHKGKVDYNKWRTAEYGIKRLEGIPKFYGQRRLECTTTRNARIFTFVRQQRGIKFAEVFPEMKGIFLRSRT